MSEKYQKIICVILAVIMLSAPFICYGGVISMAVKRISPHLATRVGGYTKVPGVVNTVTSLGGRLSTVEFMLTGASVAGLAGAVIGGGMGLALEHLAPAYFNPNGLTVFEDAAGAAGLTKTTVLELPPGGSESTYYPPGGYPSQDNPMAPGTYSAGYTADCASAYAEILAIYQSFCYKSGLGDNSVGCIRTFRANVDDCQAHGYRIEKSCNNCTPPEPSDLIYKTRDYPLSDFENELATAINAGGPYSPAASVASGALKIASDALNGNNKLSSNNEIMEDINDHLLEGLDSATVDILENQADEVGSNTTTVPVPLTPENTYNGPTAADIAQAVANAISQAGLGDNTAAIEIAIQNLAAELNAESLEATIRTAITVPGAGSGSVGANATEVQAAADSVSQAVSNAASNVTVNFGADVPVPVDPEILIPDKLSLTSVLNDFYSGLGNLPIVKTFSGMAITAGGSPTLCVNLPAAYGGSRCQNFSSYQSDLNMVGSVLLSFMTIFMMVYLFRGGN